jgi:hypothetical protein
MGVLHDIAVVSVARLGKVFSSIYTLKMGLRKIVEAATSGTSTMVQLCCADLNS